MIYKILNNNHDNISYIMKDCGLEGVDGEICRAQGTCILREQIMRTYEAGDLISGNTMRSYSGCAIYNQCIRLREGYERDSGDRRLQ